MNDEYWADVAATPWHKRDLLNIEEFLTPPVSRWGRVLYWVLSPLAVLLVLAAIATAPF